MKPNLARRKVPHKPLALIALAGLAGLAFAQGANSLGLVINGRAFSSPAVVLSGKTYVPLEALVAAGVRSSRAGSTLSLTLPSAAAAPAPNVTPGGANQRVSLEGCIGEPLFNGVWRVKVLKVEPVTSNERSASRPGWGVTLELRNGANATFQPHYTGVGDFTLAVADGNVLPADANDVNTFQYANLPQGGLVSGRVRFYFPTAQAQLQKATKLLIEIKVGSGPAYELRSKGAAYTTPTPSFRVRLDCQK